MQIGIPKELVQGETRVAATPASVIALSKLGFRVCVATQAGAQASYRDADYKHAGAEIVSQTEIWKQDHLESTRSDDEIAQLQPDTTLISFIWRRKIHSYWLN